MVSETLTLTPAPALDKQWIVVLAVVTVQEVAVKSLPFGPVREQTTAQLRQHACILQLRGHASAPYCTLMKVDEVPVGPKPEPVTVMVVLPTVGMPVGLAPFTVGA